MSRVITFSRVYPSYHPKAGQPTYFVEQIQNSLCSMNLPLFTGIDPPLDFLNSLTKDFVSYKHHTIRAGHRWKAGDWFSPRVWSGKPYRSKMIQFAPDIQIKKVWDFECDGLDGWYMNGSQFNYTWSLQLAMNDGLTLADMQEWFNKPFDGQIISWCDSIEY